MPAIRPILWLIPPLAACLLLGGRAPAEGGVTQWECRLACGDPNSWRDCPRSEQKAGRLAAAWEGYSAGLATGFEPQVKDWTEWQRLDLSLYLDARRNVLVKLLVGCGPDARSGFGRRLYLSPGWNDLQLELADFHTVGAQHEWRNVSSVTLLAVGDLGMSPQRDCRLWLGEVFLRRLSLTVAPAAETSDARVLWAATIANAMEAPVSLQLGLEGRCPGEPAVALEPAALQLAPRQEGAVRLTAAVSSPSESGQTSGVHPLRIRLQPSAPPAAGVSGRTLVVWPVSRDLACAKPTGHPRLLADLADRQRLVRKAATPAGQAMVAALQAQEQPAPASLAIMGSSTEIQENWAQYAALEDLSAACILYLVDGQQSHVEIARQAISCLCGLRTWVAPHLKRFPVELSASLTAGVLGIAYDCLYEKLEEPQRELIRQAILEHAVRPLAEQVRTDGDICTNRDVNFTGYVTGWTGIAALAISQEAPEARTAVGPFAGRMAEFIEAQDPDGGYCEGVSYWSFAVNPVVTFAECLRHVTAGRFDMIATLPYLHKTTDFARACYLGESAFINFGDSRGSLQSAEGVLFLASRFGDRKLGELGLQCALPPQGRPDCWLALVAYDPQLADK